MAPVLIEVPEDHENYKSGMLVTARYLDIEPDQITVARQFQRSWRHPTICPEVQVVYKIINTEESLLKFERYLCGRLSLISDIAPFTESLCSRDSMEAGGNFVDIGRLPGNENRRWHGTRRECNIGDKGITTFCADPKCSLCRIIKTSFDLEFFMEATGWGRFGKGIYTSSTSSKFVLVSSKTVGRPPDIVVWFIGPMTIRVMGVLPT